MCYPCFLFGQRMFHWFIDKELTRKVLQVKIYEKLVSFNKEMNGVNSIDVEIENKVNFRMGLFEVTSQATSLHKLMSHVGKFRHIR